MLSDANKKSIDHFSAITWSKWVAAPNQERVIIGHWAEDNSTYDITCPPQLRDLLIEMQNALHEKYAEVERLRRELSEAERRAVI